MEPFPSSRLYSNRETISSSQVLQSFHALQLSGLLTKAFFAYQTQLVTHSLHNHAIKPPRIAPTRTSFGVCPRNSLMRCPEIVG